MSGGRGLGLLCLVLAVGCASGARRGAGAESLRISELAYEGDPTRRASLLLVVRGLESDSGASRALALSHYERALQVDPSNPYVYLAIARHHVDGGDAARAFEYLNQAEILLEAQGEQSPRVTAHLVGLRGAALRELGRRDEADDLLARARALDPHAWGDGRLGADELK